MGKARARAFSALFEAEFGRGDAKTALERAESEREPNDILPPEQRTYAESLIDGVAKRRSELDALITETATRRPLDQMALVDLTVLRIALYELLFNNAAVAPNAVANAAAELAKRYGADGSRRLVSGVLGTVRRERLEAAAVIDPVSVGAEVGAEHESDHQDRDHDLTPGRDQPEATRVALYDRIKDIIVDQLSVDPEEVTPAASFVDDLGADSLDLVELIMSFEDEFKAEAPELEISDEDAEGIGTVQDAIDFLVGKGVPDGSDE